MGMKSHQGFTLVELAIALAISAMIAIATVPNYMANLNQNRADITAQETQAIIDAARTYRSENGGWPGNSTCSNALQVLSTTTPPMIAGINATNHFNYAVTTSCTAYTFSVDQNTTPDWDGVVVNSLPGSQVVNSATNQIRTTIGVPGTEPALDGKLSRLASANAELNRMRTDLLMGNNNINEVNQVNAQTLNAATSVNAQTVNASGTVNAQTVASRGNVTAGGSITATGAITAGGGITGSGLTVNGNTLLWGTTNIAAFPGATATVGGPLTANETTINGRLHINEFAEWNTVVSPGGWCMPNGVQARDASGAPVFCINGIWSKPQTADGGQFVTRHYRSGSAVGAQVTAANGVGCQANPKTGGCSCPAGYGDYSYISGDSYYMNPWDTLWLTHYCVQ